MSIPEIEKPDNPIQKRKLDDFVVPEAKKKRTNVNRDLVIENKRLLEKVNELELQLDYKKKMERFIECGMEELSEELYELKAINRKVYKKCEDYKSQVDYLVDVVRTEKQQSPEHLKTEIIDEVLTNSNDVYEDLKEIVDFKNTDGVTQEEMYASMTMKLRCESCIQTCKELFCSRCNSGICTLCYELLQCLNVNDVFVECPSCSTQAMFKPFVEPE